MRLIKNTGSDRVIDELRQALVPPSSLDLVCPAFSLFAFAELRDLLEKLESCRVVLPAIDDELGLNGSDADRVFRNRLQLRWLARECATWIKKKVEIRGAPALLPQSIFMAGTPESEHHRVIMGDCAFTTSGLGITPGNQFSLIQCSEKPEESAILSSWFTSLWQSLPASSQQKNALLSRLQEIVDPKAPSLIYYLILYHIFRDLGDELDEERIVKSATGIRNTVVWKKLFKFQRDGVIGAIDKLERLGGCIIADSVGLGKTFEALAIIKYYELRNDRVLVLVPKRLRDNWTLYKANDRRNFLAADLKNQIAFVTEADDTALAAHGISSIEATVRQAQLQFNRWLSLEDANRRPFRLMDMLGFDYFKLLDLLTIARSRKHIEEYYGTNETGRFPERLKPINIKPDVDVAAGIRNCRD
ncbi:MAG: hypothetical protein HY692_05780 [Cyanobacteria bacterium NC_groundwater_1444_Ag_S-0.65um_54_12]|nr:hypothetical protein [Cyanobacteria bacterium NC_groundwater_1444_Ag_S-0.65um_54_12]